MVVGLDLDIGWLPPLITQSTNPKIQVGAPGYFDASRFAQILETPTGQVTRAEVMFTRLAILTIGSTRKMVCASPKVFGTNSARCAQLTPPTLRSATRRSNSILSKPIRNGSKR